MAVMAMRPASVTALLFSMCAVVAVGQQVSHNGRFAVQQKNGAPFPQRFSWAASSIYIPFQDAQNITIAFSRVQGTGASQFEIRVDSHLVESATSTTVSPVNVTVSLAGSGPHTLTITKITEAALGEAQVDGVWLDRGSFGPMRSSSLGRRMEIIGASIMNGYGNLGDDLGCQPAYEAEDALLAVGPLVASHFGARFALLAWTGAGILKTGVDVLPANGGEQPLTKQAPTIPQLYSRTTATDPSSNFDHSQFVPQVVLLEAGGNDFANGTKPPGNWASEYKDFLQQIRGNAPDADIVVLNLPLNVLSPIRGQASSQMYVSALEQQVQELKGQGFQKLHLLDLPSSVMQAGDVGCYGHPTTLTHMNIAAIVQDYIANITSWDAVGTETSFLYNN